MVLWPFDFAAKMSWQSKFSPLTKSLLNTGENYLFIITSSEPISTHSYLDPDQKDRKQVIHHSLATIQSSIKMEVTLSAN